MAGRMGVARKRGAQKVVERRAQDEYNWSNEGHSYPVILTLCGFRTTYVCSVLHKVSAPPCTSTGSGLCEKPEKSDADTYSCRSTKESKEGRCQIVASLRRKSPKRRGGGGRGSFCVLPPSSCVLPLCTPLVYSPVCTPQVYTPSCILLRVLKGSSS